MHRRRPLFVFAFCMLTLVATVGFVLVHLLAMRIEAGESISEHEDEREERLPPALARRLERFKTLPGAGGESADGRDSAEAEKFFALAFPANDIALANLEAARAAAARLKGKDLSRRQ